LKEPATSLIHLTGYKGNNIKSRKREKGCRIKVPENGNPDKQTKKKGKTSDQ